MRIRLGLALVVSMLAGPLLAAPPELVEVDLGWQLRLEFDQPMLGWDARSSSAAIRLSPDVPCAWYWEDDTHLACRAGGGLFQFEFEEGAFYTLEIDDGALWSQAGESLPAVRRILASSPPRLDARVAGWQQGWPDIELSSEQPLPAAAISSVLDLAIDGKALAYTLEPLPPVPDDDDLDDVRFRLVPGTRAGTPGRLTLELRAGLRSPRGPAPGMAKSLLSLQVNEPFAFGGADCGPRRADQKPIPGAPLVCIPGAALQLRFNRPLAPGSAQRLLASWPAGLSPGKASDYCYFCHRKDGAPWQVLAFTADAAERELRLPLPSDLRAEDGALLGPTPDLVLQMTARPPAYRIDPEVRVGLPGDTARAALEARNIPARDHWQEITIGTDIRRRERRLRPGGPRNAFSPVPLPALDRDLVRNGGLSLAGVRETRDVASATAVAPFQLLGSRNGRHYLAWASDWASGTGIAGAQVELIELDPKRGETVLAAARADDDGVALLEAPEADKPAGSLRLLRASAGGRRTVLPVDYMSRLETARVDRPYDFSYFGQATAWDRPQFGASERLLYRPGDTVRYRVWLRQRAGNRLVAVADRAPASLLLRAEATNRIHDTWTAGIDRWGSVAGELTLPTLLPDGYYCIAAKLAHAQDNEGACFLVARYTEQAMWVQLSTPASVLRGGDPLRLDVEGGYYSGGPAARTQLRITGLITPRRFSDAYPQFRAFEFISVDPEFERDPLEGMTIPAVVDAEGRATFTATLPSRYLNDYSEPDENQEIPFGRLMFNAYLRNRGEEEAASPTAEVDFAQYPQYVGLRSEGYWLSRDADPVLDAMVASHDGKPVPDARIRVSIESTDDKAPGQVGSCELVAGVAAACPFRAPRDGRYAFVASHGNAAPVRIERYFGQREPRQADAVKPVLDLVQASDGRSPVRLRLRQPHAKAVALFVLEYDRVVRHWSREVGPDSEFEVPVTPDMAPGVGLRVMLRPQLATAAQGIATPTLDAAIDLDIPAAARAGVSLAVAPAALAPGGELRLTLHNEAAEARLVTIAIVDDSVHQQASDLHVLLDPASHPFLTSLGDWRVGEWHDLLAWKSVPNLFHRPEAKPVPVVVDYFTGGDSDETTLDTIEVTGSRLKRAEIFTTTGPGNGVVARVPGMRAGPAGARLRRSFPDAAYWNPGIELAPGERTDLVVRLPDNLTRWRVLAWSGDTGDGFSLAEATTTTSLPVELRLGLPGQLYEGDQANATVSVRSAGAAAAVTLEATARGAGVDHRVRGAGDVAANGLLSRHLVLAPTGTGDIDLEARADSARGADAVSSSVPVHSRIAARTLPQAGWIEDPVSLPLPKLPAGATGAELHLRVSQGTETWRHDWLAQMRAYPHRCWEQTLSRGLAAALALQDEAGRASWPDAQATVDEALKAAPGFQDDEGYYRFFASDDQDYWREPDALLSAHTRRGYALLAELGQAVPEHLTTPLDRTLAGLLKRYGQPDRGAVADAEAMALAAGALAGGKPAPDPAALQAIWRHWDRLSWHGRSELLRALSAVPALAPLREQALSRLRDAGAPRGLRRVISDPRNFDWAMGSGLRDQCAVTAALWELDEDPAWADRRRQFLRGVHDLYAGGTASLDTQASLHCLLALHAAGARQGNGSLATVRVAAGPREAELHLPADGTGADWTVPSPTGALSLAAVDSGADVDASLNYTAELRYRQDLRDAEATATGLQLQRHYAVLRGGAWVPMPAIGAREGDWIRVSLSLAVPALRHFVAITDPVPGGWVTRDLQLASVGGADLRQVADPGSWWFDTRQTGASEVRLYAQRLPPGEHVVHYFVQATTPGRYLAAPATAELMYGRASRATTGSQQVRITPSD